MLAVAVKDLVFNYPQQEPILRGISFNINVGERVALLGPTGTGKSTLMENLIGLKEPVSGQIWIKELPVEKATLSEVRRRVGFCFQNADYQLFMPTIFEDLTFGPLNYGSSLKEAEEVARQLLVEFGLEKDANRSAYEISGGQKRLAALASVLANKPSILILDEPTNGLDPLWRRNLAEILPRLPVEAMLIASHDLNWISKVTQRALVLTEGEIKIDLPTSELLQDTATLESYGLPLGY
ncbi:MAG: energy-coupling factor ABC transporter ATP-binding protein [Okeania sp. SIO2H7]|nr:energy-coupling factor ABC transporter ATP-binding protein [Okeania sp. SIO2H7]